VASNIDTGDVIRLSVVFKNLNKVAVDPSQVNLTIKQPDGVLVEYQYSVGVNIVKASVGNYYCDFLVTQEGMTYYKWVATGTVNAAEESSFFAKISQI
jgi:hypothetical protein